MNHIAMNARRMNVNRLRIHFYRTFGARRRDDRPLVWRGGLDIAKWALAALAFEAFIVWWCLP